MRAILLVLLAFSASANAELVLSAGVGKNIMKQNGTPFERVGIVGYQLGLPKSTFIRPQAGYFLDISDSGKSSYFGAVLLGVEARSEFGPILHMAIGPAYLHSPDKILAGNFQFNLEGGIGMRDKNVAVKLIWAHLSSAGISMPNLGRDFICAQVGLSFL